MNSTSMPNAYLEEAFGEFASCCVMCHLGAGTSHNFAKHWVSLEDEGIPHLRDPCGLDEVAPSSNLPELAVLGNDLCPNL